MSGDIMSYDYVVWYKQCNQLRNVRAVCQGGLQNHKQQIWKVSLI